MEHEEMNLKEGVKKVAEIQISLAAARVNAGMTQEDVAREMHVSKNTIVNWEKGTSEPSINQGKELASLYNIPLDYIFLPCKSN
ncbi:MULTISPECIES: helix-turn-helix transcriptional regulator [unclassified Eubacterium (in: firmicutes)]|uniref:helix-turn-helix transcriptional regulator n=1 Tax=unclassified Eubacterium (in: firmicutes) TaxID=2624479 RepID=UPI001FAA7621|nr:MULTISPECIES: helix-turn-helix transcriptional regulator [unclassified Eubacterium (in: firmicutes)]